MSSVNVLCIDCDGFFPSHQNKGRIKGAKTDTGCEVGICNACRRKEQKRETRESLKLLDGGKL